jgi:thiamine-phosphate pyrophosphorylase
MVHEDIGVMSAAGAAGLHLPAGATPALARHRLGAAALIGCSAHSAAELEAAASADADYATLSPIFPSASKPGYGPALGLGGLAAVLAMTRLPVIALGGIEIGNAADCVRMGAAGVAVMSTVMGAADPGAVMAGLIKALAPALAARRSSGS